MSVSGENMFERRLATLVNDVLDAESGPHPLWQESPAQRQVIGARARGRRSSRNLRLLAIAAIFVVGGAVAAAGGFILLRNQLRDPSPPPQPLPTAPTPTVEPTRTAAVRDGFVAYEVGGDIYLADASGSRLAIGPGGDDLWETCPTFSADGRLLAYRQAAADLGNTPDWDFVIAEIDSAGSVGREISRTTVHEPPVEDLDHCFDWSPDGQSFAYLSVPNEGGQLNIATLAGDTRSLELPAPLDLAVEVYAWSPSSAAIAIVRSIEEDTIDNFRKSEIWLVYADGSDGRLLVPAIANEVIGSLRWSRDGLHLAYGVTMLEVGQEPDGNLSVGDRGQRLGLVTLNGVTAPNVAFGSMPTWSRDGLRTAWTRGSSIIVGDGSGNDQRSLPSFSFDGVEPVWPAPAGWSADGSHLLVSVSDTSFFDRGTRTALLLVNPDDRSAPTPLLPWRPGLYRHLTWQVIGE